MTSSTTLVFPGGMAAALAYAAAARARGESLVGASSLPFDAARGHYDNWEILPYYDDREFARRLVEVARRHGITKIFTPHPVIHAHLRERLGALLPDCALGPDDSPWLRDIAAYRSLGDSAAALAAPVSLGGSAPAGAPLSEAAAAALLREARAVPGMCDDEKIWALAQALRHAPPGDIVEIGSWWGKSAYILSWLARHYRLGKVLCADPWSNDGLLQDHGSLDAASAETDAEEAWRIFVVNMAGVGRDVANFIRLPSAAAARQYHATRRARSEEFGETAYRGVLSLLHIDGNHKRECVEEDVAAWAPALRPGSWIVFDDYTWRFGDGPRIVGDAFLRQHAAEIATAFVAGSALFVQLRAG